MASLGFESKIGEKITNAASKAMGRAIRENAVRTFCFLCAAVSIIATVGIVYVLVSETVPFFKEASLIEFLTGRTWQPTHVNKPQFGIWPLLMGTLMITFGSGLVSIPLGLLVGIYLAEYAPSWVRKILKPLLELLAGIPSVVFGYFALTLISPALKNFIPNLSPLNAAAGAIVVGFMTLPLVASLCEDAISAVPKALSEAAFGLGSTKAEVIIKIVLPSALSGIVASFILALSRAVGETMAVTIAAGATPRFTFDPTKDIMTMTAQIVNFSKGDIDRGDIRYLSIFAIGLLLFLITFTMNLIAQRFVRKVGRPAK